MIDMYIKALAAAIKRKDRKACTRLLDDLKSMGLDVGTAMYLAMVYVKEE